jgi:hypothetical protein
MRWLKDAKKGLREVTVKRWRQKAVDRQELASMVSRLSEVRKTKEWVNVSFESVATFKYFFL